MKDINKETRIEGTMIRSVEFHKKQNVALVAGSSGVVSLFQVYHSKMLYLYSTHELNFIYHLDWWFIEC